ncbi:MAG: CoA pyrophosphatase [Desulfuromonas sp.]|nr:CoA pyrophosphatase [Desulfuromonas sp.]
METISHQLHHHQPNSLEDDGRYGCAAVALLIREGQSGPEVLFIQRAKHADDPWSGNLGFPGGRIDPGDATAYAAAVRETEEEVGICLSAKQFLGQLDDHHGVRIPVHVSCFVFFVDDAAVVENYEVSRSFWMPLATLKEEGRHQMRTINWNGQPFEVPSIYIDEDGPVLWGLTYRFINHFFQVIKQPLAQCRHQSIAKA